MVAKVAAKVARRLPSWVDRSELESIGRLALVEAASKYPKDAKANFPAYACWWMRIRMFDEIRNGTLGGMRVLRSDGQTKQVFRTVGITPTMRISQALFDDDVIRRATFQKLLGRLDNRSRRVIERVYRGVPVKSIAAELGCSIGRVSQLHHAAIRDMQ
jgi:RNA polymerase sigma factor (sigma-70 family)